MPLRVVAPHRLLTYLRIGLQTGAGIDTLAPIRNIGVGWRKGDGAPASALCCAARVGLRFGYSGSDS